MFNIASNERIFRIKVFQEKRFINFLMYAGIVLGFKCIYAIIVQPGVNNALPLDVYKNHNFTQKDYMIFFSDIVETIHSNNMQIASVIIYQLPTQIKGISLCIEGLEDPAIKSILIVLCLCHLTSLILS